MLRGLRLIICKQTRFQKSCCCSRKICPWYCGSGTTMSVKNRWLPRELCRVHLRLIWGDLGLGCVLDGRSYLHPCLLLKVHDLRHMTEPWSLFCKLAIDNNLTRQPPQDIEITQSGVLQSIKNEIVLSSRFWWKKKNEIVGYSLSGDRNLATVIKPE